MLHLCPACQRTFDEAGFCPFDRAALVPGATSVDQQTQLSSPMPAQSPAQSAAQPPRRVTEPLRSGTPKPTDVEIRRRTFPLTPMPVASAPTQHPAAPPEASPPSRVRSVSASTNPVQALDAYKAVRESEYDRLVGQTLDGRYFVEKKIGEGGMGVVFAARHAVIERPLAIKVLKREVMRDTATIQRFVQEAKAASRIGHPNIVDVTDFGTTPDGMTYSVMEFVDGQTLGTALRHGAPFQMTRAARIAAQIARALGAAHDKGIVHRDLKPENVFLIARDGRTDFVKIVDFGIAKVAPTPGAANQPRLTRAGSVFGTPEYMAPEQAAGRSDTDGRVDIYALGVILYEMITGRVPHRGETMVRTLAMQMLDPVEPPTKLRPDLPITPELEAVVMKALAKQREARFATMGELLAALDALQTPVGLSVTGSPVYALTPLPPGADPSLGPASPRSPLLDANAALATAAAAAAHRGADVTGAAIPAPVIAAPTARTKAPTNRRLRDEPEFVTHDRPATFEHVFTEQAQISRRRRWPILLLLTLVVGAAGGAVALVLSRTTVDGVALDAGIAHEPVADALVITEVADDADELDASDIVIVAADASTRIPSHAPTRDARVAPIAVIPETPNRRGTIMIQVLTKPEGATLYVGTGYRGPGGTQLEEPLGTVLDVTCTRPGYKPGTVQLRFDGTTEVTLCVLTRIKVCIDNIKNPFDDCELDPTKPMPSPAKTP